MTITYPLDKSFLADLPGITTDFDLLWRQEQSRTAGGRTVVKDFGSPLWRLSAQSRSLKPNELDHWRARLTTLENGLKTFRAFPKIRWFPRPWLMRMASHRNSRSVRIFGQAFPPLLPSPSNNPPA
jgi:hypothetical protein